MSVIITKLKEGYMVEVHSGFSFMQQNVQKYACETFESLVEKLRVLL